MSIIDSPESEYSHYRPLRQELATALDTKKKLREKITFEAKRRMVPWREIMAEGAKVVGKCFGAGMAELGIGDLQRILAALLDARMDHLSTRQRNGTGPAPIETSPAPKAPRFRPRPRLKWR